MKIIKKDCPQCKTPNAEFYAQDSCCITCKKKKNEKNYQQRKKLNKQECLKIERSQIRDVTTMAWR